jgi:hypothetical protein
LGFHGLEERVVELRRSDADARLPREQGWFLAALFPARSGRRWQRKGRELSTKTLVNEPETETEKYVLIRGDLKRSINQLAVWTAGFCKNWGEYPNSLLLALQTAPRVHIASLERGHRSRTKVDEHLLLVSAQDGTHQR